MRKKNWIVLFVLMFTMNKSFACEACGCGTGSFYLGMLPKFNSKFIGLRYRSLYFNTQLKDNATQFSNDYYETVELWGGWNIGKKWQLITFIPFQVNHRVTDDGDKWNSGVGDITLLTNYKIWNNGLAAIKHQLWVGSGIKLPTGNYKLDFTNPENNLGDPNGQVGTGSVDLLFNLNHSVLYGNWGLNTTLNYKHNGTNPDQFRFGNRFSVNTIAYYRIQLSSLNLAPAIGAGYEDLASNSYQGINLSFSGGYALLASTGIEMSYRKLALGVSVQSPFEQNFSDHQTTAKTRMVSRFTFTF